MLAMFLLVGLAQVGGMELFTWQSLATVTGGAAAVVLLTMAAQSAIGVAPRWLALIFAVIISVLATIFTAGATVDALLLAVINAGVIYAAATGANAVLTARTAMYENRPRGAVGLASVENGRRMTRWW